MHMFSPFNRSNSGSTVPPPRLTSGEADTESVTDVDSEEEVTAMEASSHGGLGLEMGNHQVTEKWVGKKEMILVGVLYTCTVMMTTKFGRVECRDMTGQLDG